MFFFGAAREGSAESGGRWAPGHAASSGASVADMSMDSLEGPGGDVEPGLEPWTDIKGVDTGKRWEEPGKILFTDADASLSSHLAILEGFRHQTAEEVMPLVRR